MNDEARLEFETHGGYHYLKLRVAPELVEDTRDWIECGRFKFEPTHDGSAVLVVDTNQTQEAISLPSNEPETGPAVSVMESGKVEVNRDDLESLLDTYDRPGNEVTARLRAVLEQERGEG